MTTRPGLSRGMSRVPIALMLATLTDRRDTRRRLAVRAEVEWRGRRPRHLPSEAPAWQRRGSRRVLSTRANRGRSQAMRRSREMARPRVELGTPRFSGVRSTLSNRLEMPANKPNLDGRPTDERYADSVLLVAVREMSGARSPIDNCRYHHRDPGRAVPKPRGFARYRHYGTSLPVPAPRFDWQPERDPVVRVAAVVEH
jgi:hypothetical protein